MMLNNILYSLFQICLFKFIHNAIAFLEPGKADPASPLKLLYKINTSLNLPIRSHELVNWKINKAEETDPRSELLNSWSFIPVEVYLFIYLALIL